MTFEQRRDEIRSIAEQEYQRVTWINPNTVGEIPSIPDWMVSAIVRKVFGELLVAVGEPDRKVLAAVMSTAADISVYMEQGMARNLPEIPSIEQECVSAAVMLQRSTVPPNYDELNEQQTLDMELQMALQVVTFWVSQVLVVRLRELRLEERTRG